MTQHGRPRQRWVVVLRDVDTDTICAYGPYVWEAAEMAEGAYRLATWGGSDLISAVPLESPDLLTERIEYHTS